MNCNLCPRKCNIDRKNDTGWCKSGENIKIAKIMLHQWEEPCVSLGNGSGAIFFSGCNLKCVYCQNRDISHEGYGKKYSVRELADEMLRLQDIGACNINLVTPTHYGDKIRQALDLIKNELKIPVVYNTSGYELDTEILKMAGYVDVFLTDIKYFSPVYSEKYSRAKNYYEVAKNALSVMLKLQPKCVFDESGGLKKGVIVRHLVLPSLRRDSMDILRDLSNSFDVSAFKLSLMAQYTPGFCDPTYKELKRKITTFEYESVVDYATQLGFDGYIQDKSASSVKYTPKFKEE
ncbi:MAG: radical SAM protein [Clostridia bacterium]|nr:radical SAM protein [Clostridia bacterium]